MPWLSVNHTRLVGRSDVPSPVLALLVHRGAMPGHPGAYRGEGTMNTGTCFIVLSRFDDRGRQSYYFHMEVFALDHAIVSSH